MPQMKVCEQNPSLVGVLAWWPISADRVEPPAAGRLRQRGLGLVQRQVGDRQHLDPGRHPLAFDVGADHVPVADGDPLGAALPQRADDRQDLVGHQPPAPRVGGGVRREAVAVIVDPRDPLHVRGDQDVHGGASLANVRASGRPMIDFLVKRDDFRETRIAESETPDLGPGQALLRVDSFGLTANNVTYAVFGEAMNYWDFFPAAEGWGRVPMWGFAEVERSEADGVEAGTRLFGYLPPSSHLIVAAGRRRGRRVRRRLAPPRGAALGLSPLPGDRVGPVLPARHRGRADAAAAALLHLVPDRRPARRRAACSSAARS